MADNHFDLEKEMGSIIEITADYKTSKVRYFEVLNGVFRLSNRLNVILVHDANSSEYMYHV